MLLLAPFGRSAAIKESIDTIILPVTYIINSFNFGIVPKQLKNA